MKLEKIKIPILTFYHVKIEKREDVGNSTYRWIKNVKGNFKGKKREDGLYDVTYTYDSEFLAN